MKRRELLWGVRVREWCACSGTAEVVVVRGKVGVQQRAAPTEPNWWRGGRMRSKEALPRPLLRLLVRLLLRLTLWRKRAPCTVG